MTVPNQVPPLRWWGWGERDTRIPEGLMQLLHDELDATMDVVTPPVARAAVQLPASTLPDRLRRRLTAAVGSRALSRTDEDRLRCAAGRSYVDLLSLRSGVISAAPDAVVRPRSTEQVERVLRVCSEEQCAVVPFGGGTSVVGGVAPLRDGKDVVIALTTDAIADRAQVDVASHLAALDAGLTGPQVESMLAREGLGFTLGHFPQSFEYATIGGYAATRSSGQASSGFGRFDELVRGLTLVSPSGTTTLRAQPPSATGPSLLDLVVGSEGALGVITQVTVRIRERARVRRYAGWSFANLESGIEALRHLAQRDELPDVTRLSDAEETRVSFASARHTAASRAALRYLAVRGHRNPCLAIFGWEGDGATVGARLRRADAALHKHRAIGLGTAPGKAWLRSRFEGPYLRDALMDRALLVETLETAATWSRLLQVLDAARTALRAALTERGTPPLIGCHISHVYPEGASLYFTVLARQQAGNETEQWLAAKRATTEAIVENGGAASHHHGIGRDHMPWLRAYVQDSGAAALQALRGEFDPAGIMNPGKLTA